ncbi:MAG TPA: RimK/LysX family protein [Balneolales bacterium]|nr:RimK/LysX family protein [Balneolales bacterium]
MKNKKIRKQVIGRIEKLDFPKLDLFDIGAKIDTGAFTSSIHCTNIKKIKKEGKSYIRFNLLDSGHPLYNNRLYTVPLYSEKEIKNSFGQVEKRFVIKTAVRLFGKTFTIELSLTDRSTMGYPVLLGRKVLHNRFIVDVSKKNLSYKQKVSNN